MDTTRTTLPDTDAPPSYRWVIVVAASVILALAMGQLVNGLSVFLLPLEQEFGWLRGDIALINTAGLIGLAVGGIVLGRLSGRLGMRRICVFGALALSLCILTASQADRLWQFYLLFLAAGALGAGAFFAPLIALVGNWFTAGAGLALGIVSAGQAFGQGAVPVLAAWLIDGFGWRGALMALAALTLALVFPMTLLIREAPQRADGLPAGVDEVPPVDLPRPLVVGMLGAAVLGCCTLMAMPLVHLVPMMQGCGIPAADGSGVMFAMLTAGIVGRIFFGRLADAIGGPLAYMGASLWQTAMVFGFTWFGTLEAFYLYAPLYGFGFAGVMTGVLTTTRALTPPSLRASTMGIIAAFAFAGHGLGGYIGGLFFDLTGAYTISFAAAALSGVFNLAVMTILVFAIRSAGTNPIGLGGAPRLAAATA